MALAAHMLPLSDAADGPAPVGAGVGERFQEVLDAGLEAGNAQIRSNFGEGREHETAFGEAGMGQGESLGPQNQVVDQQEIEVEGARTFGRVQGAVASVAALDCEQEIEQRLRLQVRIQLGDGVHKGRLGYGANRLGAVEMGESGEASGAGKFVDGRRQGLLRRACGGRQIGSQSDIGAVRHTCEATGIRGGPGGALCSKSMKVGFFGGSFDPPHRGHVALARLAKDRLRLDRVLFAPVGVQPLKRDRAQAGYEDRVAMTRLAIEHEPGFEVSLVDAPRADGRPNYTIDTLRSLRATLAADDQILCLMGADSFLSLGKWHRAAELLVACDFAVGARPGFDLGRLTAALPTEISVASCDAGQPDALELCLRSGSRGESRLYLLPDLDEDASASGVRASLHHGAGAPRGLDPAVAAWISERGLYRKRREG